MRLCEGRGRCHGHRYGQHHVGYVARRAAAIGWGKVLDGKSTRRSVFLEPRELTATRGAVLKRKALLTVGGRQMIEASGHEVEDGLMIASRIEMDRREGTRASGRRRELIREDIKKTNDEQ